MHPSSARAIKQELQATLPAELLARLSIGLAADPENPHSTRLAVRVHAPIHPSLRSRLHHLTRGECDFRHTGPIHVGRSISATTHRARTRPLTIGCSIGHPLASAGTLTCFVTHASQSAPLLLSNAHILAPTPAAQIGDPILQPAPADRGRAPRDIVATLHSFTPLLPHLTHHADAATAILSPHLQARLNHLPTLGALNSHHVPTPTPGQLVQKIGRTTHHTLGQISATELDHLPIHYPHTPHPLHFHQMLEIQSLHNAPTFASPGDSGSLILTLQNHPLALLTAATPTHTYASAISAVLSCLNLSLALPSRPHNLQR